MSTPSDERVTVVIPAWNVERFIEDAIGSVLAQTVLPAEIIVADDGSTDATAALAAAMSPLVRVLDLEHRGVGPTRTSGIRAASTEWLALLDADDVWLPTKLARQLAVIDADPSLEAVFTAVDEFEDFEGTRPRGLRAPRLGVRTPITSTALLRADVIERIGDFGTFGRSSVGDWFEWWVAAVDAGVVSDLIPDVLVRRRLHGDNNSLRAADGGATFLRIARAHLHATRAGTPPS